MNNLTFAVAVNNDQVLNANLLASPCFRGSHGYEILLQRNYASAALAYNDALTKSNTDLIVFVHQDIYLPEGWIAQLSEALKYLQTQDPAWGVVGCFGVTQDNIRHGSVYSGGRGVLGAPLPAPARVQTLDEIVLVVKKSSGLCFDAALPHFHGYGTDICLRALSVGKHSYAVPAFCLHNTQELHVLPREFYASCSHLKRVWKQYLPIQTTCVRITRWNIPILVRRARELYLRYIRKMVKGPRVADVTAIPLDACRPGNYVRK